MKNLPKIPANVVAQAMREYNYLLKTQPEVAVSFKNNIDVDFLERGILELVGSSSTFLDNAFEWRSTKEGWDFWRIIECELEGLIHYE